MQSADPPADAAGSGAGFPRPEVVLAVEKRSYTLSPLSIFFQAEDYAQISSACSVLHYYTVFFLFFHKQKSNNGLIFSKLIAPLL